MTDVTCDNCGRRIPPAMVERGRRWHDNWCMPMVPPEKVRPLAEAIIERHGSVVAAASAYAERFGLTEGSALGLFNRMRHGHSVQDRTWDRLTTFAERY